MTPIFLATVKRGKLVFEMPVKMAVTRHLESLEGHAVELIVRPTRSQRSLKQNNYLHACVFLPLAKENGDSVDDMKMALMAKCWGTHKVLGLDVPVKGHTSKMTVDEASHFIDWVIPFALEWFNFRIPLPNEVDYER